MIVLPPLRSDRIAAHAQIRGMLVRAAVQRPDDGDLIHDACQPRQVFADFDAGSDHHSFWIRGHRECQALRKPEAGWQMDFGEGGKSVAGLSSGGLVKSVVADGNSAELRIRKIRADFA